MTTFLPRRVRSAVLVPLGLVSILAMAIALAAFSAPGAKADDLQPAPPASFDGQVASTGGGTQGSTVPDGNQLNAPAGGGTQAQQQQGAPPATPPTPSPVISNPAPAPAKVTVRVVCRTAHRTHTRTCRTYRNNTLTKICTKRRHRHQQCRKVISPASPDGAHLIRSVRVSQGLAHAASFLANGFVNPPSAGIVRLYKVGSPVPGNGWCSGSMIEPGLVLTAAHCVYNDGSEASSDPVGWRAFASGAMQVVPGDEVVGGQGVHPYGVWNIQQVFAPAGYTKPHAQGNDETLDWAILELAPDSSGHYAGNYTGIFSATWDKPITTSTQLWSAGYPASGIFRQASYNYGENQYFCNATADKIYLEGAANVLEYPCAGTGGISGGPVWAQNNDGSWTIVAVHNRGNNHDDSQLFYGQDAFNYWLDGRFGSFWNSTINYINTH